MCDKCSGLAREWLEVFTAGANVTSPERTSPVSKVADLFGMVIACYAADTEEGSAEAQDRLQTFVAAMEPEAREELFHAAEMFVVGAAGLDQMFRAFAVAKKLKRISEQMAEAKITGTEESVMMRMIGKLFGAKVVSREEFDNDPTSLLRDDDDDE